MAIARLVFLLFFTALAAAVVGDSIRACSRYPLCAGLDGDCCPTADGHVLDCCQATCVEHPACAADGLKGQCCPTTDGVMLDCCEGILEAPVDHFLTEQQLLQDDEIHVPWFAVALAVVVFVGIVSCSCLGIGQERTKKNM
eukprot:CAMPEP_0206500440 /NCGR_PEP_ID=MMETSP0324_2-20121206/52464_1 /ASSEMBLY_ACC=CAM_ASM_000836 /TAXON_ID=2866 /ORGANISM="Crypthecodinium cohnii, Strain Seligo" /LENGTH=140 /DNA_ID=CAMNT_0053987565 /DNA_START=90 /DNA_END=513 /DNA_ORIENTATION=+